MKSCRELLGKLDQIRIWDGSELGTKLAERLKKELQRWVELTDSIREEEERREQELQAGGFGADQARRLAQLKSIGDETACSFSVECFAYRHFNNGREVGAYVGLTPTPFDSGESRREQGISKAGNARLRWRAIEVSWLWQRYQPDSELTKWFKKRFANGSARQRRIGIVAMARKLVVALWRYLEYGIVPEGATLKA
jgi:transposase